jgi:hypothetical protein
MMLLCLTQRLLLLVLLTAAEVTAMPYDATMPDTEIAAAGASTATSCIICAMTSSHDLANF